MCGMCLPHCPTYRVYRSESDSPRGRIALMSALAQGELLDDPRLRLHLDRCLACRACEAMCPSEVPYGQLIDAGRAMLEQHRPPAPWPRLLRWIGADLLLARPRRLRPLAKLLRLSQRSGMDRLAPLLGLGAAARLLPPLQPLPKWHDYYPPGLPKQGDVALFLGCIASVVDSPTSLAAIRVLNRLGYGVYVPSAQVCCGAVHQHAGRPERALASIRANLRVFAGLPVQAVIGTASGCTAMLQDYPCRLGEDSEPAAATPPGLPAPVRDISDFLTGVTWPTGLAPAPTPLRVTLHNPCTLLRVLHKGDAPGRLLERIPSLEVCTLEEKGRCCGAAGTHMLTHPSLARALRGELLDEIEQQAPDVLATSNIGCALHLRAGLRERGLDPEVLHPVQLLSRAIA
jgi:glycolate oxidase iron-sulfur subunit